MSCKCCCLLLLACFALTAAQYYNPYNTPSPTFSSLTGNPPYYYPTVNPIYYFPSGGGYNDYQIRIWPYVIGQYLYPTYNNNNVYNPYASQGTPYFNGKK